MRPVCLRLPATLTTVTDSTCTLNRLSTACLIAGLVAPHLQHDLAILVGQTRALLRHVRRQHDMKQLFVHYCRFLFAHASHASKRFSAPVVMTTRSWRSRLTGSADSTLRTSTRGRLR